MDTWARFVDMIEPLVVWAVPGCVVWVLGWVIFLIQARRGRWSPAGWRLHTAGLGLAFLGMSVGLVASFVLADEWLLGLVLAPLMGWPGPALIWIAAKAKITPPA